MPAFKISSGEIVNLPFLRHVAAKGRPVILSTGMADAAEVATAVKEIAAAGLRDLVLLHCLSNYPADPAEANLRAITTMHEAHGLPVGFSDHTEGVAVALAAVALGACVIEKHFTLDRSLPGRIIAPRWSPIELTAWCTGIRRRARARRRPQACRSRASWRTARSSARAWSPRATCRPGRRSTADDLAAVRPGTGLSPAVASAGRRPPSAHRRPAGTPIAWDMLV